MRLHRSIKYASVTNVGIYRKSSSQTITFYRSRRSIRRAWKKFQNSLELNKRIGNIEGKAYDLAMLSQLLKNHKDYIETALVYLKESLEILEKIGSPEAEKVKEIMADVIALGKSE